MNSASNLLVLGATGQVGKLVAKHLKRSKANFSVGSRRSEEHTSELQSRLHLVCRLLLEKKKNNCDVEALYLGRYSLSPVARLRDYVARLREQGPRFPGQTLSAVNGAQQRADRPCRSVK